MIMKMMSREAKEHPPRSRHGQDAKWIQCLCTFCIESSKNEQSEEREIQIQENENRKNEEQKTMLEHYLLSNGSIGVRHKRILLRTKNLSQYHLCFENMILFQD